MLGRELGCRRRVRTGRLHGGQREPPAGHAARADVRTGAGPGTPGRGGRGPRPGHRGAHAGGKERQRPAGVQRAGRPRVHRRVARRLSGRACAPGPADTPGHRRGPGPAERGQVPAGRDRGAGRPRRDQPRRGAPARGCTHAGRRCAARGRWQPRPDAAPTWPGMAGDHEGARAACAQALAEHERLPMPFELAGRCSPRGSPSGGRGASRRRGSRSAQALAIFERLGATLWAAKARRELSASAPRPLASGLTQTQQRVAALIAQGQTNREIAAAMFITVNTVQTHVRHIFQKLGVRSRTELAAVLLATPARTGVFQGAHNHERARRLTRAPPPWPDSGVLTSLVRGIPRPWPGRTVSLVGWDLMPRGCCPPVHVRRRKGIGK